MLKVTEAKNIKKGGLKGTAKKITEVKGKLNVAESSKRGSTFTV